MTTTVIQDCCVLDSTHPSGLTEHQDILIQGNMIESVLSTGGQAHAPQVIDGRGLLAVPGLINAHTHSPENVLRATTEQLPLELWVVRQFAFHNGYPPRLTYLMTLAGAAEMIHSGITAVLDHFWMARQPDPEGLDAAMQAYDVSGMRVALAPMLEDQDLILSRALQLEASLYKIIENQEKRPAAAELLESLQEFMDRWHGRANGRLMCMPGPAGPQWCSNRLLQGCQELAQRYATGFHMHMAETHIQAGICRTVYGKPAVLEMDTLGLLGPGTSLAHCVWVNKEEIEALARTGTVVIHNPVSNLKLGSGIAPIPQMLEHGVTVALGTDGASSNDNQNMFTAMKLMGLLHSPASHRSRDWLSARQVMAAATLAGAKALGQPDNLGRIHTGCLADLTLLDLDQAFWSSATDAIQYTVYSETGSAVRHVIIDGRLVMENRKMITFPERDIYNEMQEQMELFLRQNPQPTDELDLLLDTWKSALHRMDAEENGTNGR